MGGEVDRFGVQSAAQLDAVRLITGLEGVDREVEEDLEEVRPVDVRDYIPIESMHGEVVALGAGVAGQQLAQIDEDLVGADVRLLRAGVVQEAEVAPGNLEAASDLARQLVEVALDGFELLAFDARGILHRAVYHLDESADHGERAVDVVQDAGVDLAPVARHLLAHALVLDLALELVQAVVAVVKVERGQALLRGAGHGGAHRGDVEGLVQVVAGAVADGLARRLDGLEGGEHDDLDGGIDLLEFLEQVHARHPEHHNVEHCDVDGLLLCERDGIHAVGRGEHVVFVLENDTQRLPGPLFVIDDEEGRLRRDGREQQVRSGIQA